MMKPQHVIEQEEMKRLYFEKGEDLKLIILPSKAHRKCIVLSMISECFLYGHQYTEFEVSTILKPIYEDYVLIRRYLIDFRLLRRSKDGSIYERMSQHDKSLCIYHF